MKVVVKRHAGAYQVYRVMAIAQAVRALGHEVSIDCLKEFSPLLAFCGLAWKNPHHPYAWDERPNEDPKLHRAGGARFDAVIDLDDDGAFQPKWMKSGLLWWDWIKTQVKAGPLPDLAFSDFPDISSFQVTKQPEPYVLICPFGPERDAFSVNAKHWEAYATEAFLGIKQLWLSDRDSNFGPGREVVVAKTSVELLALVSHATGVMAGNSLAAAIAQSTQGTNPTCQNLHYVTHGPIPKRSSDFFATQRANLDLPLPSHGVILQTQDNLTLKIIG